MSRARPTLRETFGLGDLRAAAAPLQRALVGRGEARPSSWDLTSVRIFKPRIGLPAWFGHVPADRRAPVYNLFNRAPRPHGAPYSVRVTDCRDFLGGRFTYDSHNGTDFVLPVGTLVVAAAPGLVVRVGTDLDRGGTKVCIDHGDGLLTTSNHLARPLVRAGERVVRGAPVGLSGASGLEFLVAFPWVAPHLHFNVWLDGTPVDPFAADGEVALWRGGNQPVPYDGRPVEGDDACAPTPLDEHALHAAIEFCRDPSVRADLHAVEEPCRRACELHLARNYWPDLFPERPRVERDAHPRRPRLDLPLAAEDYVGVRLPG